MKSYSVNVIFTAMFFGAWSDVAGNECTAVGRFPDAAVPACRGYIMCINSSGGTFSQYTLTCPLDFVFNPDTGVCTDSVNYKCHSADPEYICNATGHFENPYLNDCKSFVLCSTYLGGSMIPRIMDCPDEHIFDPLEATCVNATTHQCGQFSISNTTIENTTISVESNSRANALSDCVLSLMLFVSVFQYLNDF